MPTIGWKTIVIQNPAKLSFNQGFLVVDTETSKNEIPVAQIKLLVIESLQVSLTAYLINELQKNGVGIIFCDEKHMPLSELVPYHSNYRQTECIMKQIQWNQEHKEKTWKQIVEMKIYMQISLLRLLQIDVPNELVDCYHSVQIGDSTNREGQAARLYFNRLFGNTFIRHFSDNTNYCLNYGYSLILSGICRKLAVMGYLTNIGIHHCGLDNPYNFACDLMEPFRPIIDRKVYESRNFCIGDVKSTLVNSLYDTIVYSGKEMQVNTALEVYVEDVLKCLNTNNEFNHTIEF